MEAINQQQLMTLKDDEPLVRFFAFDHLPERLALVSKKYASLVIDLVLTVPRSAERTVALRKLLESKDAAVRALL